MPGFALLRRKARSGALLEGNRMEKRLEKLSLIHGSDAYQGGPGPMNQRQKQRLQQAEQTVVRWEEDSAVTSCPFCLKSFGLLSSRRHHCRLCGRIICHRPTCSTHLLTPLLDLSSNTGGFTAERTAQIRACRECAHVVDRQQRRAQGAGTLAQEMLLRMYLVLCQQMRKVEETLPVFNMLALKHHEDGMGADLARAARIRRQLTGAFGELDAVSKGIEQLPCGSMTDARLHSAVRRMVAQYLQIHMFPLTMLPSKPTPKSTVTPQQQQQQQKGVMGLGLSSTDADVARASSSVSVRSTDAGSVVVVNGVVEAAVFDPSPSPSLSLDTATPAAKSLVGAMGGTASNLATSLLSYVIPPRTTLTTTTAISRKDTTSPHSINAVK
ncbi:carboxypeptidase Y-deficient [Kickxella alabastrina]|uniref:Carboxypeptidase Y-deficient n=1 Tax=Kickxella alabastrina TaxID=61397 RepID=A0ACC1IS27_9FUNG|nr:carboxypeptidase Y-deficient [Kickxella alabastrina]